MLHELSRKFPLINLEYGEDYYPDLNPNKLNNYLDSKEAGIGSDSYPSGRTTHYHYHRCTVEVRQSGLAFGPLHDLFFSVFSEDEEGAKAVFNELEQIVLEGERVEHSKEKKREYRDRA